MRGTDLNTEIASTGLATQPIGQFLASVEPLTAAERRTIVDQALLLMEEAYVHLPLKRAMHAVDPVQRLRVLRHRLEIVSERAFHEEMISTFMSVRDLHTNYMLPAPYSRSTALLPFEVVEFFHLGVPNYIVGGVLQGFSHPTFKPGVRVTHLSGVPIARAIELNARRNDGSNAEASHARGLERLTFRPLMMSLPPDEEWVDVRYLAADGSAQEIRFPWSVVTRPETEMAMGPLSAEADPAQAWMFAQGVDLQKQAVNAVKKHLFSQEQLKIEREVLAFLRQESAGATGGPDFNVVSKMPDVFTFGVKKTAHGDRGYIRIATFSVNKHEPFVREFIRIAKLLPQDGLIVDVRGNGGGNIYAGEMLLQTMSAVPVEPERFHFINTPRMLELVRGVPQWFDKWTRSMSQAVITGATYSQGLPFSDPSEYNQIGRQYTGKVALLTDAFCYSTTDIFAAGFQDHGIGPIIGNHGCTGAGGANVFGWDLMKEAFDSFSQSHPIAALPKGGGMRVAVRRATRVRALAGEPLEDLGVVPDRVHRPTLDDLLEGDRNLLDLAGELTKS